MKKKKLSLNKKTITNLNNSEMNQVLGGTGMLCGGTEQTNCQQYTCDNTCGGTCGGCGDVTRPAECGDTIITNIQHCN